VRQSDWSRRNEDVYEANYRVQDVRVNVSIRDGSHIEAAVVDDGPVEDGYEEGGRVGQAAEKPRVTVQGCHLSLAAAAEENNYLKFN
jgi:hypothetical protein